MSTRTMNETQSRACYRAAYQALCRDFRGAVDVVIDLDQPDCRGAGRLGAGFIASGCAAGGDMVVFANVHASDFGDVELDEEGRPTVSLEDFVDGCMDSFGLIEIPDDGDDNDDDLV